jgi:hypothetical protein
VSAERSDEAAFVAGERQHQPDAEPLIGRTSGQAATRVSEALECRMTALSQKYDIPPELDAYIASGFLELLAEHEAEKTVEFHVPALRRTDSDGRITSYALTWIHPAFNAQFCQYYDHAPGDLPNFHVTEDTTDLGDELLDLGSLGELTAWLEEQAARV